MATAISTNPSDVSSSSQAPLRFRKARSLDEVDALEPAWRAAGDEFVHPLAQFIWIRAGLSAFGESSIPHVIGGFRDEQLVALAPLVSKRLHGVRRLFLSGVGEIFEPGDFAWSDERALQKLFGVLARGGSPLLLERIGADSPSVKALRRAYRGRAIVIAREQPKCPFIALDESWLEPEQHLNSGRRSDLRRARRKAEQIGAVTTEIRTPDLNELPDLLDTCFEIEAKSWKGAAGTALVHDAQRSVFYRQYAEAACVEGVLRICFLRIGDHVVAMQLAIEQGGGFWLLKVGYDAQFAACSPGLLLMRDTIRYSVEAGLATYEFLGKAETWTEVWTKTEHPYLRVRVYPLGVRGMAALVADTVAQVSRRWRKK